MVIFLMDHNAQKQVTIYSTPTCHFCHMAKDYFGAHNIAFTDYNVGEKMEKRAEMVAKSGQLGVPVIVVTDPDIPEGGEGRDHIVIGFDEEYLANLLGTN